MTGIPIDQLPAAVRKRIAAMGIPLGQHPPATSGRGRPAPSRAGIGEAQPCAGRCTCGQTFPTFTAWLRHCDTTDEDGHSRFDIDLEPQETQ